ncbi:Transposon TX1 uncharacterized 149 kDa protein [Vitis vinifera]|uniref:Transposon TX1 uncharacterized 149 kDa protein n=1 Tax=Vitis vinifera TaxID=29760 RepID=A0A438D4F3_VITVI|nr:Transposon TX1 uncharacterized 149 kDa protein [Vitis vinifera]
MNMNGDKAPGPNGFIAAFWQSCWDFAKEEILDMFKEFHEQNSFLRSLNNTFLVLLQKKEGLRTLGDYRPISLLGGLYKLLAKVLANRLKKVIGKVVSPDQNGFCKKWGLAEVAGMDVELYIYSQVFSLGERSASQGVLSLGVAYGEVKEKGGLSLRKLTLLNKALLGKWVWRFACVKEDLWKQVLVAKYGQEDLGWRTKKANGVFGVGVWKEILKESAWCWENMVFKVEKAPKSDFGLICGVDVQCCHKGSRIFMLWLCIRIPQWKRCETRTSAKAAEI